MPCPSPGSARGIKGRMIDREADDGLDEGRDVGGGEESQLSRWTPSIMVLKVLTGSV